MAFGYHCSIVHACEYYLNCLRISSGDYWFSQHIAVKGEEIAALSIGCSKEKMVDLPHAGGGACPLAHIHTSMSQRTADSQYTRSANLLIGKEKTKSILCRQMPHTCPFVILLQCIPAKHVVMVKLIF